jgi:hypothetical protein
VKRQRLLATRFPVKPHRLPLTRPALEQPVPATSRFPVKRQRSPPSWFPVKRALPRQASPGVGCLPGCPCGRSREGVHPLARRSATHLRVQLHPDWRPRTHRTDHQGASRWRTGRRRAGHQERGHRRAVHQRGPAQWRPHRSGPPRTIRPHVVPQRTRRRPRCSPVTRMVAQPPGTPRRRVPELGARGTARRAPQGLRDCPCPSRLFHGKHRGLVTVVPGHPSVPPQGFPVKHRARDRAGFLPMWFRRERHPVRGPASVHRSSRPPGQTHPRERSSRRRAHPLSSRPPLPPGPQPSTQGPQVR